MLERMNAVGWDGTGGRMYVRSTLRRVAVICAVVAGVAVGSWHIGAVPTGVAIAPDKSDSSTEKLKLVGTDPSRDYVQPVARSFAAAPGVVANDLGPDNMQVKH
jgi:hypothetical protein